MEQLFFSNSHLYNPSLSYLSQPPQLEYTEWNFEENKIFENALAEFDLDCPNLFEQITTRLPGKTIPQIKKHFEALTEDIEMIESGLVLMPNYKTSESKENKSVPVVENKSGKKRRKGVPWTSEEHELFLKGLDKFGKGDWRSISRQCVVTKNPTQVASHAQKYFLRLQNSSAQQNVQSTSRSNTTFKDAIISSTASSIYVSAPNVGSTSDQFYHAFPSYQFQY